MSEVVMCLGFDEEDSKKGIVWQLPQELFPYVDAAVGLHGALIVEVWLSYLVDKQYLVSWTDVLFREIQILIQIGVLTFVGVIL